MIELIIIFVVMLNPFALLSYLEPLKQDLSGKKFNYVLFKASLISFIVYAIFVFGGNFLFERVFQINFESFRIFGGIIIFSFAFHYIMSGDKGILKFKSSLDDLASDIALPFMVGAGTISVVMLMTHTLSTWNSLIAIGIALATNFLIIFLLGHMKDIIPSEKMKYVFDENMSIFIRIMGFFSGAIGLNMVITGIQNLV